jgi:hypothetical protein
MSGFPTYGRIFDIPKKPKFGSLGFAPEAVQPTKKPLAHQAQVFLRG